MATGNILAEGNIDKVKVLSIGINPAPVPANSTATQSVACPGVRPGDFIYCIKPLDTPGFLVGGARCLVADNIQLTVGNPTGSSADPGLETWLVLVIRTDAFLNAF